MSLLIEALRNRNWGVKATSPIMAKATPGRSGNVMRPSRWMAHRVPMAIKVESKRTPYTNRALS